MKAAARQKWNTKGFTMIELIVTLVLMGILLSIGASALSAYTRFSKFKRQNETAQALFVAAQTSLTQSVTDGTAARIKELCEDSTSGAILLNKAGIMQVSLTSAAGKAVSASDIWQKKGTDPYGTLYALMATPADFQKYASGTEISAGAKALYEILDAYVYDKSLLKNGAVCLEFDPAEGMVYSVFYCQDAAGGFTYTGEHAKTDIRDRTEKTRRENMVGYYGVDSLSKSLTALDGSPAIQGLRLTNGETLDLNWTLDSKNAALLSQLKYTVEIYDADTNNCVLKLEIHQQTHTAGNDIFVSQNSASAAPTIEATVYRASNNSNKPNFVKLGACTFPAYVDAGQTVHLILDAVDLNATEYKYQLLCQNTKPLTTENTAYDLRNTFSLHRFLLEQLGTQSIYCKLSTVADANSQAALPKTSNTEPMYFGGVSADSTNSIVYTVKNARHLNNIRYEENEKSFHTLSEKETLRYDVAADIVWNKAGGIVQRGGVYDTATSQWSNGNSNHGALNAYLQVLAGRQTDGTFSDVSFPGISELREYASLTSAGGKAYTISGLTLNSASDLTRYVPGISPGETSPSAAHVTGLFLNNYGTITKLALEDVFVTGQENVGAFCGVNYGMLENLEVKSGSVYGLTNVGGIAGAEGVIKSKLEHKQNNYFVLKDLINRADVTGHTSVGGITGQVKAGKVRLHGNGNGNGNGYGNTAYISYLVQKCENYGTVRGDWKALASDKDETVRALYQDIYKNGTPQDNDAKYIGGIVGYADARTDAENNGKHNSKLNTECRFEDCVSAPAMPKKALDALLASIGQDIAAGGTAQDILRGTYVGGIVGYSEGALLKNCTTKQDAAQNAYVWGNQYVGGIVGGGSVDLSNADRAANQLLVTAAHVVGREYVGGVVGQAQAQNTEKDTAKTVLQYWNAQGFSAAVIGCVGGLAGENAGSISDCAVQAVEETITAKILSACGKNADYVGGAVGRNLAVLKNSTIAISALSGRNFVGGLVGCEGADAALSGCALASGNISGQNFVGGLAGLNLSASLMPESTVTFTPNSVAGKYFVGGYFGAFIVPGDTALAELALNCNAPQATVSAEMAYAGGFAGLCATAQNRDVLALPDAGTAAGDTLLGSLALLTGGDLSSDCAAVETAFSGRTGAVQLTLGAGSITLASIRAGVYAGGVTGYIPAGCTVFLHDLTNATPLQTTASVAGQELGVGDPGVYSYTGGIVGKISKNVTVAACKNAEGVALQVPQGCCTAALAEVNCGRVVQCAVGNFGSAAIGHVGGLIGVNAASGEGATASYNGKSYTALGILDCSISGVTVVGGEKVGGLTVWNYGLIQNPTIQNAAVQAAGDTVGAAAAIQGGSGTITLAAGTVLSNVKAEGGSAVGLLAGESGGNAAISGADGSGFSVDTSCTVTASGKAGGIVGILSGGTVKNCAVAAAVQGSVCGAIAGENKGTISACRAGSDTAVSALKGTEACGGIVGINSGTIQSCTAANVSVSAQGTGSAGGMAGSNSGMIQSCTVANANIAAPDAGNAGGIAGNNKTGGTITNVDFGSDETQSLTVTAENYFVNGVETGANAVYRGSVLVQAGAGSAGGTAGQNEGAISAISVQTSDNAPFAERKAPQAKLLVAGGSGSVGGVVGLNATNGTVTAANTGSTSIVWAAQEGNSTGCGGIIGSNVSGGVISNCNNWATVIKMSGSAAGGLIGRCAAAAEVLSYTNCANYGSISAAAQAGGLIGALQGTAVTLDGCANFGKVTAAQAAGGVLGLYQDSAASGTLTIQGCENHGRIGADASSTGVGGILGSDDGGTAALALARCANTGLLCGEAASSGGILGQCTASGGSVVLQCCINYGCAAASGSAVQCGITPADNVVVRLEKCVGVAGTAVPVTNAATSACTQCYYFGTQASGNGTLLTVTQNAGSYSAADNTGLLVFTGLSTDPTALTQANNASDDSLAAYGTINNARYTAFTALQQTLLAQLNTMP